MAMFNEQECLALEGRYGSSWDETPTRALGAGAVPQTVRQIVKVQVLVLSSGAQRIDPFPLQLSRNTQSRLTVRARYQLDGTLVRELVKWSRDRCLGERVRAWCYHSACREGVLHRTKPLVQVFVPWSVAGLLAHLLVSTTTIMNFVLAL